MACVGSCQAVGLDAIVKVPRAYWLGIAPDLLTSMMCGLSPMILKCGLSDPSARDPKPLIAGYAHFTAPRTPLE